jgi:hypothetical protein
VDPKAKFERELRESPRKARTILFFAPFAHYALFAFELGFAVTDLAAAPL